MLCTCISTLIVNVAGIKKWVLYVCDGIGIVGGKPLSGEKGLIPKIQGEIPKISHIPLPTHLPSLHRTPDQLEAEARIKEEKESPERIEAQDRHRRA